MKSSLEGDFRGFRSNLSFPLLFFFLNNFLFLMQLIQWHGSHWQHDTGFTINFVTPAPLKLFEILWLEHNAREYRHLNTRITFAIFQLRAITIYFLPVFFQLKLSAIFPGTFPREKVLLRVHPWLWSCVYSVFLFVGDFPYFLSLLRPFSGILGH